MDKVVFSRWGVVAAGLTGMILSTGSLSSYSFSLLVVLMGREFGWSRGAISTGLSLYNFSIALTLPLFGYCVDRWGGRLPSIVSILLYTALICAFPLIHSWPTFLVAFAALGVTAGGLTPVAYTKAITNLFDHRRGLALGIVNAGAGLGGFILPIVTVCLMTRHGWRGAFVGLGFAVAGVCVPSALIGTTGLKPADGAHAAALHPHINASFWSARIFWWLAICIFCIGTAVSSIVLNAMPLLTDRGIAMHRAAAMLTGLGFAALGGRIATGVLMDRMFVPRLASALFAGLAIAAAILLASHSTSWMFVALLLTGFVLGAEVDLVSYLIGRYFPMVEYGKAYGSLLLLYALGFSAGGLAMGVSYDRTGSYDDGLWGAAALAAVAALAALRTGPYRYRPAVAEGLP